MVFIRKISDFPENAATVAVHSGRRNKELESLPLVKPETKSFFRFETPTRKSLVSCKNRNENSFCSRDKKEKRNSVSSTLAHPSKHKGHGFITREETERKDPIESQISGDRPVIERRRMNGYLEPKGNAFPIRSNRTVVGELKRCAWDLQPARVGACKIRNLPLFNLGHWIYIRSNGHQRAAHRIRRGVKILRLGFPWV